MVVISIECSHKRGMGHFYRALNIYEYLQCKGERVLIVLNSDVSAIQIISKAQILYKVVEYEDRESNWEQKLIEEYQVNLWILDKFETGIEMAAHIKNAGVILAAIDDCGEGASLVDLHFCSMLFCDIQGKHIFSGLEYMVLNPQIADYRRQRTGLKRIIVTLGGSDTYGVTVEVLRMLKAKGIRADIVIGLDFQHKRMLNRELTPDYAVYENVPSLITKFYEYDLAITGGGVTCFEANASGLPCIIIANEPHEVMTGKYLAQFGGAKFAGYYKEISEKDLDITGLHIEEMSKAAMQTIPLNGLDNIYQVLQAYRKDNDAG